jgi:hypothetical protein
MAESIILHFAMAGWDQIGPWLDARAMPVDHRSWNYPEPYDPVLLVYEVGVHSSEFDPEDLDLLVHLLGRHPTAAVCLQLRRAHGDRSCDAAEELAIALLGEFDGIADDTFARDGAAYWSLDDLRAATVRQHGRFLDCYRMHPSAK